MMGTIGELNENPIHCLLKSRIEPDTTCHEVRLNGYIVDVLRDDGVYEIQSRHFYLMREKLSKLLENHKVTMVYPVIKTKWIVWVDEGGQIVRRRKSPKTGQACHILAELYGIRGLLAHKNLSFVAACLDAEDYRLVAERDTPGGKGVSVGARVSDGGDVSVKKAASTRRQRQRYISQGCVPLNWLDMIAFGGTRARGLERVMPELPDEFTSREFGRSGCLPRKSANMALKVLDEAGMVERVGKEGRLYLYRKV
ncbi:MAG: hypothetical protein FWF88_12080 [Peptococcaceae bacterium]|nr:hypothetical protein [Peptococcaceae bacterium]